MDMAILKGEKGKVCVTKKRQEAAAFMRAEEWCRNQK